VIKNPARVINGLITTLIAAKGFLIDAGKINHKRLIPLHAYPFRRDNINIRSKNTKGERK